MDYLRGLPFPLAFAALFVIVLLRAGGTYVLGRAAHAGAGRTRLRGMLASARFRRAEDLIARWGAPVVAASFLTVGFQTLANLAAGVTRLPLRRYLPALVVGGVIWAALYATVGLLAFAALRELWAVSPLAATVVVVLLVGGLVTYVALQFRRSRREESDGGDRVAADDRRHESA